jgi:hypothetical protein
MDSSSVATASAKRAVNQYFADVDAVAVRPWIEATP